MSDVAIRFEGVSKRYRLGSGQDSLRETLTAWPRRLLGRGDGHTPAGQELWALRDVSFEVKKGEALGIIGPNGAGKTTILKLLAGVTRPTAGRIEVNGKLSALIELGAGFHPDLTGRENIYLNGAILGLRKGEIDALFDEIVAFAELEQFIDTPVKRYSSGMYARLGFSVAAHVNPDVLLVDEVLSVGDVAFQTKSFRKIAELRKGGITIVLVSHNPYAIRENCDRALIVWQGQLAKDGSTDDVVSEYLDRLDKRTRGYEHWKNTGLEESRGSDTAHDSKARLMAVSFLDIRGNPIESARSGDPVLIRFEFEATGIVENPIFGLNFYKDNQLYLGVYNSYAGHQLPPIEGRGYAEVIIDSLNLPMGFYKCSAVLCDEFDSNLLDWHSEAYHFQIARAENSRGLIRVSQKWTLTKV